MGYSEIVYIAIAYLIGSISPGYLITKWTAGQNILQIGWRKASGTNVFKNVSRGWGVTVIVLDFLKGAAVILLGKHYGFSGEIQAFAGVFAVIGHNWSVFINFSGGRGIAVFGGVLLVLSPWIFFWSFFPFLIFAFLWTASPGTILSVVLAATLGFYLPENKVVGIFSLLSLSVILLKRLSPVDDLFGFSKKDLCKIIWIRLIFDDNSLPSGLRIKKILKRVQYLFKKIVIFLA